MAPRTFPKADSTFYTLFPVFCLLLDNESRKNSLINDVIARGEIVKK